MEDEVFGPILLFSESRKLRKKIWSQLSFGGGMGSYHGIAGFNSFSHFKSVMYRPTVFEFPLKYFPFSKLKFKLIKKTFGV